LGVAVGNFVADGNTVWLRVTSNEWVGSVAVGVLTRDTDFESDHVSEADAWAVAWETLTESLGVLEGSLETVTEGLAEGDRVSSNEVEMLYDADALRVKKLPLNSCEKDDVGVGVRINVDDPVRSGEVDMDVVPLVLSDGVEELEWEAESSSVAEGESDADTEGIAVSVTDRVPGERLPVSVTSVDSVSVIVWLIWSESE
jgi:hypothetical protein